MRKFLFIIILFPIAIHLPGQDTHQKNLPGQIVKDHGRIWNNTLKPENYNLKTVVLVFAFTGLSMAFDEQISEEFAILRDNNFINIVSSNITHIGDPLVVGGTTILTYGSGWLFKDQKIRQTAILMGGAYLHTGIITMLGKWAFARQRPLVNNKDQWHFFPYSLRDPSPSSTANQSFPSGHTSGIFAIATVMAKQYSESRWIPPTVYSVATLTGISRIVNQKHWLSDVIIGAALGYGIGNFVVKRNQGVNFTLFPVYWENSISLSMSLEF